MSRVFQKKNSAKNIAVWLSYSRKTGDCAIYAHAFLDVNGHHFTLFSQNAWVIHESIFKRIRDFLKKRVKSGQQPNIPQHKRCSPNSHEYVKKI